MCSELLSGKIVSTLLPRARSSSTCVARCMPQFTGVSDLPPNGDSTNTRASGCQIGILGVGSVAAVDVSAAADPVGDATGTTGGDGVNQVDPAVAVEHDRFTGMGIDRRDEHRSLRPELTGQPRGDGGAPLSLPGGVRGRIHVECRRAYSAAHVGRILSGGDDPAHSLQMVGHRPNGNASTVGSDRTGPLLRRSAEDDSEQHPAFHEQGGAGFPALSVKTTPTLTLPLKGRGLTPTRLP